MNSNIKDRLKIPQSSGKVTDWNSTSNNQYPPPTVTSADYNENLQLKLAFAELISQINTKINAKLFFKN